LTDKYFKENPSRVKKSRKGPNSLFKGQKKENFDSSHIWFTLHEFPVITQKNYVEPRIHQILTTQDCGRQSNIAFITKIL